MTEHSEQNKKDKNIWARIKLYNIFKKNKCPCLDSNTLAAYLDGRTSKRELRLIEEHLVSCSLCLDTLVELRLLLKEKPLEAPPEIIQRAKSLVAVPPRLNKQRLLDVFIPTRNTPPVRVGMEQGAPDVTSGRSGFRSAEARKERYCGCKAAELHLLLRRPYPYLRNYISWALVVALLIIVCLAGVNLGQGTFINYRKVSTSVFSEILFDLSGGDELGIKKTIFYRR